MTLKKVDETDRFYTDVKQLLRQLSKIIECFEAARLEPTIKPPDLSIINPHTGERFHSRKRQPSKRQPRLTR
jgi:hypothetical protein